jgi:predicted DNA-binding transcriptional regulator AlpA
MKRRRGTSSHDRSTHDRPQSFRDMAPDALLKGAEIRSRLDISNSTFYNWINANKFPKPLKLGSGFTARWRAGEVADWMDRQQASGR